MRTFLRELNFFRAMMINPSPETLRTDVTDTYPADENTATLRLASLLRNKIQQQGALPFDAWMQQCLYHPELGYYTRGAQNVGREGDFFTSVSVGKCFGMLLAHRIRDYLLGNAQTASLEHFDLIEMGANTGQLAADILDTLQAESPALYQKIRYTICEPLPTMRQAQQHQLAKHAERLCHISDLREIATPLAHAVFLSNELIDAFPVKRIRKTSEGWKELFVNYESDGDFHFTENNLSSVALKAFCNALPSELSNGYTTEFRPGLDSFAESCSRLMQHGMVITIDYGFTAADYYSPQRTAGTLRTFFQHTAAELPLENIGQQDITAHVDFSQLIAHFSKAGFTTSFFDTQTRYLTLHATQWFQAIEQSTQQPPSKLIRQFQTLTHPTMMGRQFQVLECRK